MKQYVVVLAVFCLATNVVAENKGIEHTNFSLSTSASHSDSGNLVSVFAGIRLPIAKYTGASLSGGYSDFNAKNNYIDSSNNSATLGLFVRKYDLGIINASYRYSRSRQDSTFVNLNNTLKSVNLSGTYYYKNFDLSLGRSKAEPDSGDSQNTSSTSISYYVNNNLQLGAAIFRMDADSSTIFISYQPQFLGNSTSISASYQDSETNDTFAVSLSYYFDTKVSLKDRTRKY